MKHGSNPRSQRKTATVVGLGNIGSPLIDLIARLPFRRITVVDPDRYELKNRDSQSILPGDLDKPKALVQKRRIQKINPSIDKVEAIVGRVENVPLGKLRCDLMLTCLDSRQARCAANEIVFRLGIPYWIDAGVNARDGLLARVTTFLPGSGSPCYQCSFSRADVKALATIYPCASGAAPTNAPLSLGTLAASLMSVEINKVVLAEGEGIVGGRETLFDASSGACWVTTLRRNPECAFSHEPWRIERIQEAARRITADRVFRLARQRIGRDGALRIRVGHQSFVRTLQCENPDCGRTIDALRLEARLRPTDRTCPTCKSPAAPLGFYMMDGLSSASADKDLLNRSLGSLGVADGDVVSVKNDSGAQLHFEIGGD